MNILETFHKQLDDLSVFQILSQNSVYGYLKNNFRYSISPNSGLHLTVQYDFEKYQEFYFKSIFLLGYSYYEAFLYNIAFQCLQSKPELCSGYNPKNFSDEKIQKELRKKCWKFDEMKKYLKDTLKLKFEDKENLTLVASRIRNCFMHNNGIVDDKLSRSSKKFVKGKKIVLDNSIVNDFGLFVREFSQKMYEDAKSKYMI